MTKYLSDRQVAYHGAVDALTLPALALGSTMLGFGAIAREAGFDFWMTTLTTLSVWGMPGQIAFVSLYAAGSSMFLMVVAVALANMRMMLMVISGVDMLKLNQHNLPFYQRLFIMHFMAITNWAQLSYKQSTYEPHQLLSYYKGFSSVVFVCGMTGTMTGYFLDDLLPSHILRLVIYITPLYILLLLANARQTINRLAGFFGAALSPFIYLYAGDWAILIAGIIGGTAALIVQRAHEASLKPKSGGPS
jgi:predicted branched-subunit amino acid permease